MKNSFSATKPQRTYRTDIETPNLAESTFGI
jgi:hypothetical protein